MSIRITKIRRMKEFNYTYPGENSVTLIVGDRFTIPRRGEGGTRFTSEWRIQEISENEEPGMLGFYCRVVRAEFLSGRYVNSWKEFVPLKVSAVMKFDDYLVAHWVKARKA